MGNHVGVSTQPKSFSNFCDQIEAWRTCTPQEVKRQHNFQSVLALWRFKPAAKSLVEIGSAPVRLGAFESFSNSSCYIVLHLHHNTSQRSESSPELASFLHHCSQALTPRGLSSPLTLGTPPRKTHLAPNNVFPVVYIWNGIESSPLVKAITLTKGFHLLKLLQSLGQQQIKNLFHSMCDLSSYSESAIAAAAEQQSSSSSLLNAEDSSNHLAFSLSGETSSSVASGVASVVVAGGANDTHQSSSNPPPATKTTRIWQDIFALDTPRSPSPVHSPVVTKKRMKKSGGGPHMAKLSLGKLGSSNVPRATTTKTSGGVVLPTLNMNAASKPTTTSGASSSGDQTTTTTTSNDIVLNGGASMKERLAHFDKMCNQVTDQLYLGSETVAANKSLLKFHGITHILNCAGTICLEYHPNDFVYKYLSLVDGKAENINCLLYDVIDWIRDVLNAQPSNRIFIHCQQGVSRSSSMVIAYLMWKQRTPFARTHLQVKEKRGISNPNPNFTCQLGVFWKNINRSTKLDANDAPLFYWIRPHTEFSTELIVCDPINRPPVNSNRPSADISLSVKMLDPRGTFILRTVQYIFLWIGKDAVQLLIDGAKQWVDRLVRYESAPKQLLLIDCRPSSSSSSCSTSFDTFSVVDATPAQQAPFWKALCVSEPCDIETTNSNYDHHYNKVLKLSLAGVSNREKMRAEMRRKLMSSGQDPTRDEGGKPGIMSLQDVASSSSSSMSAAGAKAKVRETTNATMYSRQDDWEDMGIFDIDDLEEEDQVFVLAISNKSDAVVHTIYVWFGSDLSFSKRQGKNFAQQCIKKNALKTDDSLRIRCIQQDEEPDKFWDFF